MKIIRGLVHDGSKVNVRYQLACSGPHFNLKNHYNHTTTSGNRATPMTIRFTLQARWSTKSITPSTTEDRPSPCGSVQLHQTQMRIFQEQRRTLNRMAVGSRRWPVSWKRGMKNTKRWRFDTILNNICNWTTEALQSCAISMDLL